MTVAQAAIAEIIDSAGDGVGNELLGAVGVVAGSSGSVYVSGLFSHTVFRVEADGTIHLLMDMSGDGAGTQLVNPSKLILDDQDNLFVTGSLSDNVFKVAPSGQVTVLVESSGDGLNPLQGPTDVAVDSAGNVFVVGVYSDNVFKITPTGTVTQILDAAGAGAGAPLDSPTRLVVDDSGNVYVIGVSSRNLFRIAPDGTITELMDSFGPDFFADDFPRDLAVAPSGDLFVCGYEAGTSRIWKVSRSGAVSFYHLQPGTISELAVDSTGSLYYSMSLNDKAYRLDPDGTATLLIDSSGDGMGNDLDSPAAIAVDEARGAYVACAISNNVFRIACGPPTTAFATPYNGSRINLETLTASEAVIGSDWTATIDPHIMRGPGAWILLMRSEASAGTIVDLGTYFGLPAAGNTELLVNLDSPFGVTFLPGPHLGGGIPATFTVQVPNNCDLVGQSWNAQAIVFGALPVGPGVLDPWFSSAVSGVIGNQ